ncbi:[FeFe] hydrogenase H-cluster maturation GTPase HydF [Lachnospiraceae bacterium BSM-380-WT-5A]|uniref:[FeFe] hydrogenase H-cluster maturation GTPase HydF n=1 Tax=Oliverpabstia intestinalis TaxID=2606633 RepID=A0A7X2P4F1_9FIRM|nr:[FeFe] hydrogenase H-cluster maturation GTPase HydF [Oliverpabstia intestinalis]MST67159.1 [FeFe] hydrogenase H-cluster maturation GTPase HydF [Oliverpabstia intestinalis]
MGLNDTPSGERVHIGFFGRRNAGKSSLVNAVTGQELAVVSQTRGTTTDPVSKAMELLPVGPVVIIDTPGFDDEGALGELRVRKTRQVLNRTDVAVLVADSTEGLKECDRELIALFRQKEIPYLIAWNKCDLLTEIPEESASEIYVSATERIHIEELKEKIARLGKTEENKLMLVGDLIHPGDLVVLVIPIDKAAPKGRLILPQQQVIRDILEAEAAAVCVKEYELRETLDKFREPPALVITDSQVFAKVSADVPPEIPLTSFSILMARYKGLLDMAVRGVAAVEKLQDGDTVLIAEGCTHHRQCDDIGSVKIPRWLKNYTGKKLNIELCSGREFPDDLSKYALIIHCGGCMLNEREVRYRMKCAADQQVPITNYGIAIAYMQGILKRSIGIFPHLLLEFEE